MESQPIAYLNGQFLPRDEAKISPLDRGFVFGDGVYEVLPIFSGRPFYLDAHIDRLNESLKGIRMEPPHTHAQWHSIVKELIQKNGGGELWLYLQVTRGAEPTRNHALPNGIAPTVFAICFVNQPKTKEQLRQGIKTVTVKDIRWKYCQIKTTARLAYVLMYQQAKDQGADEGIVFNNGFALEGTSSNIFIVRHNVLNTPPKSNQILSGITRDIVLSLAEKHKIQYRETKISENDLLKADELWITSSVRGIHPAVELNGHPVGTGKPGPLWERMWDLYAEECAALSV